MELAQHAGIVMSTLDESIKKLGNVDYFMDYLHSVGKLHTKIPGFKGNTFGELRDLSWLPFKIPWVIDIQTTLKTSTKSLFATFWTLWSKALT
ncbi:neuroglobin [Trichonephila clavata]|uniref:Neuroglobin n=1 Tax=Trichonephila clavata TaxID=2740835 RepID=A0A8X6G3U5_TRICU|nr:neuroglobin [Trichonephila clavata]